MKHAPHSPREPHIVHITTNTGDQQRFVIRSQDFAPDVLRLMPGMQERPLMGYRLTIDRSGTEITFHVVRDADSQGLTRNVVRTDAWPPILRLETTILAPNMSGADAAKLADLEQCAAIALAGIDVEAL